MTLHSPALGAFTAAVAAADPDSSEPVHREVEAATTMLEERELVIRALTAASRSTSKALKETPRATRIENGEAAFVEFNSLRPIGEGAAQLVAAQLAEALSLAADNLGPIPAGRLGAVKAPGEALPVVEEIRPDGAMLEEMARKAGAVVGAAGAGGFTSSLGEVKAVIDGCPLCVAEVQLTGGTHQSTSPGEGPVRESGICESGHRLNRPQGAQNQWKLGTEGDLWADKRGADV